MAGSEFGGHVAITYTIWPTPNGSQWNNTAVTVTFKCTNAPASCTSPTTVSTEGASQTVHGVAVDGSSNQATADATVNIDLTPPTVAISSPSSGSTTSSSVTVTGSVGDALSGIATVKCNGVEGAVSSGTATCDVALNPGTNSIAMVAIDNAGNSKSASIRIVRTGTVTTATIMPHIKNVLVGQKYVLQALDDFGQPISGSWSSSDSGVATVSASSASEVLKGISDGSTTITFDAGTLEATATISVSSGSLASDTPIWDVPLPYLSAVTAVLHSQETTSSNPTLFTVELSDLDGSTTVRALTADGAQSWQEMTESRSSFCRSLRWVDCERE